MLPEADRAAASTLVMAIASEDMYKLTQVTYASPKTAQVDLSGVYVASTGNFIARFGLSPGHTPALLGDWVIQDRLLVGTQAQTNTLAGLKFASDNNPYPDIPIQFIGNNRAFDIAPLMHATIALDEYTGTIIPHSWDLTYDGAEGKIEVVTTFHAATTPAVNVTGDFPDGEGGTIVIPNLPPLPPLPSVPSYPTYEPVGDETVGPSTVIVATTNFGFLYTTSFSDDSPTWYFMNTGLTTTQYNDVRYLAVCPNGAIFMGCKTSGTSKFEEIWRAESVGAEWIQVYDDAEQGTLICLNTDPDLEEACIAIGGSPGAMKSLYYNTGTMSFDVVATGIDGDNRGAGIAKSGDKWICQHAEDNIFQHQAASRFDYDGSLQINTLNPPLGQTYSANEHRVIGGGGYVYGWNVDSRYLRTYIDGDIATSNTVNHGLGGSTTLYPELLACDPTGQYLMGGKDTVIGQRSSDYGATFGPVSATLGIGYNKWANCDSPNSFLTATVQVVKYTGDFGDSWVDKSGNIAVVAPLCAISKVRFVSW